MKIEKSNGLQGTILVPGDKSISHRAVMIGSIAEGDTEITDFLMGRDCLSTIACMRAMGVKIDIAGADRLISPAGCQNQVCAGSEGERESTASADTSETGSEIISLEGESETENKISPDITLVVHGVGLHGLKDPGRLLDAGNSGTTMRLLSGILAGQKFSSEITGDSSLSTRPMRRITEPLNQMGAKVSSVGRYDCAPLTISGGQLKGIAYHTPVASAQVKSCILFAGLYADGMTCVIEPSMSRNHTELMLNRFGADISYDLFDPVKLNMKGIDGVPIVPGVVLRPGQKLTGQKITVPGDISSAAYLIAAALLVKDSCVTLPNVGINPTRDGFLRVVAGMGGIVEVNNQKEEGNELMADLTVYSSSLTGVEIGGGIIPTLIDEIPMIAVMAAFAKGDTVIKDAQELRAKESDRIVMITESLKLMGASYEATDDGMIIHGDGGQNLHGAVFDPKGDHRMAMACSVAGLMLGNTEIKGADCADVSYPGFYEDLKKLQK